MNLSPFALGGFVLTCCTVVLAAAVFVLRDELRALDRACAELAKQAHRAEKLGATAVALHFRRLTAAERDTVPAPIWDAALLSSAVPISSPEIPDLTEAAQRLPPPPPRSRIL